MRLKRFYINAGMPQSFWHCETKLWLLTERSALWHKNVIHFTKTCTLKKMLITSQIFQHWHKIVIHRTKLSTLWDKIVIHLTNFSALWDKMVFHIWKILGTLRQICAPRHKNFDTVRQKCDLTQTTLSNFSVLWKNLFFKKVSLGKVDPRGICRFVQHNCNGV